MGDLLSEPNTRVGQPAPHYGCDVRPLSIASGLFDVNEH